MPIDPSVATPLRIFCVEDNPLIVMHIEQLIEEAGHLFAGFADSFSQLRNELQDVEIDGALVDLELADGCTGPEIAIWLRERGIPSIFVTGQDDLAAQYARLALDVVIKPISPACLLQKLELFRRSKLQE